MTLFLSRLILLKLQQLRELSAHKSAEMLSERLQYLLSREETYIENKNLHSLSTSYDEALFSYYLFLQQKVITSLEEQKLFVKSALIREQVAVLDFEF